MVDLSTLASIESTANSLANVILVNPQKNVGYQPQIKSVLGPLQSGTPPAAFLFHYEGENTVTLETDITDHYLEDNTAIQDNSALKPPLVTVQGYIGEQNNVIPPELQILKTVADKLVLLSPFTPQISATALIAYNNAIQIYQTAILVKNAAVAAFSSITGKDNPIQTEQQKAFLKFYGYWQARQLFTIQTPWAIFTDMMIKSLRVVQDEETKMISDFEVTFKKMRFTKTILLTQKNYQARLAAQAGGVVDHGFSNPIPSAGLGAQLTASGIL